jgi:hypothetical protein
MTSPVICNAEYMKSFLKEVNKKFPPPFNYVDKYTLEGLDVYDEWLDEQKKFVEMKRFFRKAYLEKYNFSDTSNDHQF